MSRPEPALESITAKTASSASSAATSVVLTAESTKEQTPPNPIAEKNAKNPDNLNNMA
jgi:hypothetical protein